MDKKEKKTKWHYNGCPWHAVNSIIMVILTWQQNTMEKMWIHTKKYSLNALQSQKSVWGLGGGKSFNDCTDSGRTFNHLYNIVQKILDQFLVGIHD